MDSRWKRRGFFAIWQKRLGIYDVKGGFGTWKAILVKVLIVFEFPRVGASLLRDIDRFCTSVPNTGLWS